MKLFDESSLTRCIIFLFAVEQPTVELIASSCPQLASLNISCCVRVSSIDALRMCKQLRVLNVSQCVRIRSLAALSTPMHQVMAAGLRQLGELFTNASELVFLDLTGCCSVRKVPLGPVLETLFLVDCCAASDRLLLSLAGARRETVGNVSFLPCFRCLSGFVAAAVCWRSKMRNLGRRRHCCVTGLR